MRMNKWEWIKHTIEAERAKFEINSKEISGEYMIFLRFNIWKKVFAGFFASA